ncbi:DCAF5-like protein [Mya arenaria]|uniref:DCAF5-like protein n=1 Tax=Mya arenaria TaxID=6604 RepID=A0ABY7FC41_MYAAR|nr:DCAF5-like protein [Mya arenaria]
MALNKNLSANKQIISFLNERSVNYAPRKDAFFRQKFSDQHTLYSKDLVGHYGCVNAIEFSHGVGQYMSSGGDDRRVLVWNMEKALSDIGKPRAMKGEHHSNIFCIAFDIHNTTLFSGGNDEQVIVHDIATGETKDVFSHDDAVYGVSPDPTNPSVFASACDDGRILIYDTRDSCADPFVLANYASSMHSVMYNPVEPRLLVTANAKEGVGLWDVRKPLSCLLRYGGGLVQQSCMSVRFNQLGDRIIALRRRLPPYVLSGSDEFNLYMWAVPEDLSERMYINSAHMVLKGHRSIVNQVRFNQANHIIVSSGVEKIIKVWSAFPLSSKAQNLGARRPERRVYSHEEYINLVLQDGHVMSHDYSQESTEEDPRMMAFFDSLVQRELDGWSSDDSMSSHEEALYSRIMQLSQSDIDSDDSIPGMEDLDDSDTSYSPFTIAFASVMASQATEGNDRFPNLNRALENAERERQYSNISASEDEEDVVDTIDIGVDITNIPASAEQVATDADISEASAGARNRLSDLVKRKKEEMKTLLRKRMQKCRSKRHSSQNNRDSNSDSDDCPFSSLNLVIGDQKSKDDASDNKAMLENKSSTDRAVPEKEKEATRKEQRLKMLKNLRKRILDSESDNSDLEANDKVLSLDGAVQEDNGICERVQFKKITFKRKDIQSSLSKSHSKDRSSPDLGPFIQKALTNDSKRSSKDVQTSGKKHPTDPNLSSKRGKQKHKHYRHTPSESENNSSDNQERGSGRHRHSDCHHRNADKKHSMIGNHRRHSENDHERQSGKRSNNGSCNEHGHSRKRHRSDSEHRHRSHRRSESSKPSSSSRKSHKHRHSHRSEHGSGHRKQTESSYAADLLEPRISHYSKTKETSDCENDDDKKKAEIPRKELKISAKKHKKDKTAHIYSNSNSNSSHESDKNASVSNNMSYLCSNNDEKTCDGDHSITENQRNMVNKNNQNSVQPSCSYSSNDKERVNQATGQWLQDQQCAAGQWPQDDDQSGQSNTDHSATETSESDHPTWMEFKRFKNSLERARKRYKKDRIDKKGRKEDDK